MSRTEKLLMGAIVLLAIDVGVRLGSRDARQSPSLAIGLASVASAQAPIVGAALQPRYIITTNQLGNVIYVWEDEGKGYIAKIYTARDPGGNR